MPYSRFQRLFPECGERVALIFFQIVKKHAHFFRALLGPTGPPYTAQQLREYGARMMLEPLIAITGSDVPLEILCHHLVGSLMGMVGWWVNDGTEQTPEEMAILFAKMNGAGLREVFHLTGKDGA
jgi:hypothetical protein